MMENNINFPETVILIDVAELNLVIEELKNHFEKVLNRRLQDIDIPQLMINLTLDADIPENNKETQVIFVYDSSTQRLSHCMPSDLNKELNGVAFQDDLGEFIFASLSPEEMTTREDLYFDLLHIIGESSDVKQIVAIPFQQNNKQTIHAALEEIKDKKVTLFGMEESGKDRSYSWQMLAYPVMQVLGIKGDEI